MGPTEQAMVRLTEKMDGIAATVNALPTKADLEKVRDAFQLHVVESVRTDTRQNGDIKRACDTADQALVAAQGAAKCAATAKGIGAANMNKMRMVLYAMAAFALAGGAGGGASKVIPLLLKAVGGP